MNTALCCEAVAFVTITGLRDCCHRSGWNLPTEIQSELGKEDNLTYVVGRWLTSHPSAWERDSLLRPVCPGPLQHNHCLWKYAESSRSRASMVDSHGLPSSGFNSSGNIFGLSSKARQQRWDKEKHAYYGFVTPNSIVSTCNISRQQYNTGTMDVSNTWLETCSLV